MKYTNAFKKSWRRYKDRGHVSRRVRVAPHKHKLIFNMRNIVYAPTSITPSLYVPAI
jgi:hypothetical protein